MVPALFFKGLNMKKKTKDIVVGSIVIAFGIFYFTQTLGIKKIPFIDPIVGSAMFPRIIAVIIVICGVAILISGIRQFRKTGTEQKAQEDKTIMEQADEAENGTESSESSASEKAQKRMGARKIVLVLLSFALYAYFMDKIGFAVASGIYLFSQMILMDQNKPNRKSLIIYAVLSIVLAAAIFSLFRYGFGLILPKARWF